MKLFVLRMQYKVLMLMSYDLIIYIHTILTTFLLSVDRNRSETS